MGTTRKAPAARPLPVGVAFAERFMSWLAGPEYHTPAGEFLYGTGAVFAAWCFDHDRNPFVELHEILDSFPFKAALGTTVPAWALTSGASAARSDAPKEVSGPLRAGGKEEA